MGFLAGFMETDPRVLRIKKSEIISEDEDQKRLSLNNKLWSRLQATFIALIQTCSCSLRFSLWLMSEASDTATNIVEEHTAFLGPLASADVRRANSQTLR